MTLRIGVISDAHGNWLGLQKGVKILRRLGAEKIYFLGDAVGYIPGLHTIEILIDEQKNIFSLLGNHDEMLISGSVNKIDDKIYQINRSAQGIYAQQDDFLKNLKPKLETSINGNRILFVHGSPRDPINGYVYPDTDIGSAVKKYNWIFMGHTHHPFKRKIGDCQVINVGSCGLPRDDGRFGAAALANCNTNEVSIIRYDITKETEYVLSKTGPVHHSVSELFQRRKIQMTGQIVK